MNRTVKGEDHRHTTICIDSYEKGVPTGRIYNRSSPEGTEFHSMTHFLLTMEKVFNESDFPKAFNELRRFTIPPEDEPALPTAEQRKGAISTFTVRILFRQNASWQGSILWQEGRQEQYFRSVLELILLMDNALRYKKTS